MGDYDSEVHRFEKIHTIIHEDSNTASLFVANEIASLVNEKQKLGKKTVIGLATGSTPTKVYDYLVKFHKEGKLSFKNVVTFNLDEYYPMNPESIHSYVRFMNEHLFDHIDIDPKNVHIPDGSLKPEEVRQYCQDYEEKIANVGGIDIQILGIGRTGHIGFNEPGSSLNSKTRLIRFGSGDPSRCCQRFFWRRKCTSKSHYHGCWHNNGCQKNNTDGMGRGKISHH